VNVLLQVDLILFSYIFHLKMYDTEINLLSV